MLGDRAAPVLPHLAADPEARARRRRRPPSRVLVLSGRDDLRMPPESARRTASQYPNAKLLAVPGVGHSALPQRPERLRGRRPSLAFLHQRAAPGARNAQGTDPAPPHRMRPSTVAALRPTKPAGLAGRTFSAVTVTLTGVGFDLALSAGYMTPAPGLAQRLRPAAAGRLAACTPSSGSPACASPGALDDNGRGTLTVSGGLASGTITYTRSGARGVIDGRAFTLR